MGASAEFAAPPHPRPARRAVRRGAGRVRAELKHGALRRPGRSYSIGTGVDPDEAWPRQLAARLADLELDLVANLAVNGSTADDVATEQMPDLESLAPDLASLLVGVNDVVQGVPEERYGARVSEILDGLLQLLPASGLFGVATPDYTASRQGTAYGLPVAAARRGPAQQRDPAWRLRVPRHRVCGRHVRHQRGGVWHGGHARRGRPAPSGAQYARWVDAIEPAWRRCWRYHRTTDEHATSELPIRVRMAPSPTGPLHIGTARTSLYNFLFARHFGGTYVLRVEDTDLARGTADLESDIIDNLHWLGITWDEGPQVAGGDDIGPFAPYRQSQRSDALRARRPTGSLERRTPTTAGARRRSSRPFATSRSATHEAPRYNGRCLRLTDADRAPFEAEGRQPALRFKVPPEKVRFDDLIRGEVEFDNALLGDFIIVRGDGIAALPLRGGDRRRGDGDQPRRSRRGPPLEHAKAHRPDPGARLSRAEVRAHPADPECRPLEDEQAQVADVDHRLSRAGLPARGDGQLPCLPGLEPRDRGGDLHAGRADRSASTSAHVHKGGAVFDKDRLDYLERGLHPQPGRWAARRCACGRSCRMRWTTGS